MHGYYLGFDVGGTKTEVALFELSEKDCKGALHFKLPNGSTGFLTELVRNRIPTEREKGYRSILSKIKELSDGAIEQAGSKVRLKGVGLGLPGTIHPETFAMLNGNTNAFVGENVRQDLEDLFFDVETVQCANDANCFALAEVLCGVGHQHERRTGKPVREQLAVGVILGTGCGGGFVNKGEFIVGKNGGAAEIGHSILVSGGRACFCGRQGCAEQYVSGSGLELEYKEISGKALGAFKGPDVFKWAKEGQKEAQMALGNYRDHLSSFLANVTNMIDPDYFVLGGGVSAQDALYSGLEDAVASKLFIRAESPTIYKHTLGDSAGVIGSALLAIFKNT